MVRVVCRSSFRLVHPQRPVRNEEDLVEVGRRDQRVIRPNDVREDGERTGGSGVVEEVLKGRELVDVEGCVREELGREGSVEPGGGPAAVELCANSKEHCASSIEKAKGQHSGR